MTPTPWEKEHEYRLETSDTPITVDGYAKGEPMALVCEGCGDRIELTEEPSPGIDDGFDHDPNCPNRFAKSDWYRSQLL